MKIYTKAHVHTVQFGDVPVRACVIDAQVWWHLNDVGKLLGIKSNEAIIFLVRHRDPKHFNTFEGPQLRNILFDKTPEGEGTAVGMNHEGLLKILAMPAPEKMQALVEWLFNKEAFDLLRAHKTPPSALPPVTGMNLHLSKRSFRGLLFHTYVEEGGEIWWKLEELCNFLDCTQEEAIELANSRDKDDEGLIVKRVRFITFNDSNILASNHLGTLLLAGLKPPHRTGKTDGFYPWLANISINSGWTPGLAHPSS